MLTPTGITVWREGENMDISLGSYAAGEYTPVPRRDLRWNIIEPRRKWASACGNIVVYRHHKAFDIRIEGYFNELGGKSLRTPPRWSSHPSKASALHFAEHVYADANPKRMEARMYAAPIHIEWKREEPGIYNGRASISGREYSWGPSVRIVGQPDGWHLEFIRSEWWRYEGDCSYCTPEVMRDFAIPTYGSKRAATEAAGYVIRDILGFDSASYGFSKIPEYLSGWFDDGRGKELLESLVADAVKRGLCRELFIAHVYGAAIKQSASPSVVECAEAAKALLCDFVISTWAEAK